jgi:anti-anti-sigma factor
MPIECTSSASGVIVKVDGSFAQATVNQFVKTMDEIVAGENAGKDCIIDLEKVTFMDSRALGSLLYYYMHLKNKGLRVFVSVSTDPTSYIKELFDQTKVSEVLGFISTLKYPSAGTRVTSSAT